jgi:flavin-dependent dehydrogenase
MIVVVGGGVAGAATAAHLAAAGARVRLVERTAAATHKVCGEFISAEAQAMLAALGVDLGDAVPIERVRLRAGARTAEAPLPFGAASLSRRVLDERLLQRAAALGVEIRRGVAAASVDAGGLVLANGERIGAEAVVLASGKHDLRGAGRPHGSMLGLKMQFATVPPGLERTVELRLFDGGYAGLEPVEGGRLNLCVALEKARFAGWPALVAALGMADAAPLWARPLAVGAIPYGFLHRGDGPAYRVGDQLAVIPSFAGDGIAIALASAQRVAAAIATGVAPGVIHAALAGELAPQFRRARLLAALVRRPGPTLGLARLLPGLLARAASATRLGLRV